MVSGRLAGRVEGDAADILVAQRMAEPPLGQIAGPDLDFDAVFPRFLDDKPDSSVQVHSLEVGEGDAIEDLAIERGVAPKLHDDGFASLDNDLVIPVELLELVGRCLPNDGAVALNRFIVERAERDTVIIVGADALSSSPASSPLSSPSA
jgi:hypothetical protein